jgi:hypothetical protein
MEHGVASRSISSVLQAPCSLLLGGRQTGPVAGYNLLAQDATARIAIANVPTATVGGKQAGNGLRCGTHGKPFPCTVCGLRG